MQEVHASVRSFAAVLADGTVVSWGDDDYVGAISVKPDLSFPPVWVSVGAKRH